MVTRHTLIVLGGALCILLVIFGSLSALPMVVPVANNWVYEATQINRLYELGFTGADVTIGIVDTGVDVSHHELDRNSFLAWKDYVGAQADYYDDSSHGTHIAGILVARGSLPGRLTGINLRGIAYAAQLVIVKVVPPDQFKYSSVNDSCIAQSIQFCIDQHVDIILLSLGSHPTYHQLNDESMTALAIQQAVDNGMLVVAPAGNDGYSDDGDVAFPGVLDEVISVGSVDQSLIISQFSSQGHQYLQSSHPHKKPELVAPGENIMSTRRNSRYGELSGTSQAAAVVAGGLALLLEAFPEFKAGGVHDTDISTVTLFKEVLMKTASKIGTLEGSEPGVAHDDHYGYGLIQLYDAYMMLAEY